MLPLVADKNFNVTFASDFCTFFVDGIAIPTNIRPVACTIKIHNCNNRNNPQVGASF
jgi:hypothetical protein